MPADMPGAELALGVTRAELHIAAEQWEQARATLAELRERAPKHRQVLALSARVLAGLDDWEAIAPLLPELRRQKVLTEAELGALTVTVRAAQLTSRGDGPREAFEAFWLSLPKADRQHPALLERYLDRLPAEQADKGLELLREVLKKRWEPSLLGRYAGLRGSNPGQQFQLAEAWLAGHERDPALLLVLGRLARRAGLWGKARSYLETSLGIAPVAEAYRHLGEVLLEMGDAEGAARRFREGLETLTGGIEPAPARFQPALRALPADASDPALAELQALSRVSAA